MQKKKNQNTIAGLHFREKLCSLRPRYKQKWVDTVNRTILRYISFFPGRENRAEIPNAFFLIWAKKDSSAQRRKFFSKNSCEN